MGTAATYRVVCDLDIDQFDRPAAGRAAARAAVSEMRRLRRADERIRSVRRRRVGRSCIRVSIELAARTPLEAADVGRAILRTGVHASGGATTGWGQIVPQWSDGPTSDRVDGCATWASHTAAAVRRLENGRPPLPHFISGVVAPPVIDLRCVG